MQIYIIDYSGNSVQHFNLQMTFIVNGGNLLLTCSVQVVSVCAYSGRATTATTSATQTNNQAQSIINCEWMPTVTQFRPIHSFLCDEIRTTGNACIYGLIWHLFKNNFDAAQNPFQDSVRDEWCVLFTIEVKVQSTITSHWCWQFVNCSWKRELAASVIGNFITLAHNSTLCTTVMGAIVFPTFQLKTLASGGIFKGMQN